MFQNIIQILKKIFFFNDSKRTRIALPFSKKTITITLKIMVINIKNNGNFCYLNYLHSFKLKNKLKSHKKVCENKDFCYIAMLSEYTKTLQYEQYQNLIKHNFSIV